MKCASIRIYLQTFLLAFLLNKLLFFCLKCHQLIRRILFTWNTTNISTLHVAFISFYPHARLRAMLSFQHELLNWLKRISIDKVAYGSKQSFDDSVPDKRVSSSQLSLCFAWKSLFIDFRRIQASIHCSSCWHYDSLDSFWLVNIMQMWIKTSSCSALKSLFIWNVCSKLPHYMANLNFICSTSFVWRLFKSLLLNIHRSIVNIKPFEMEIKERFNAIMIFFPMILFKEVKSNE